ncbi:modification methylase Sau3AI (GATC cytosine-specific methyltransferase) [Spiroplasma clarkii]|uniref:DNA cytosine methyltransferase n=1 Tax=Spiroplasma clarkii TaxID=2139 RepID=UPI000B585CE7|nr:DNA (cytosine-5-)-methyltransferase [Spiroplasma clarkii]ARU91872.1 modification methylase Sau3AI (GATC cytosine-specific methyltransferase) [Spiroplasma clarkii]
MKTINVVELFAGVGGFRLGLERYNKNLWNFIFANQWEPNKKVQHAFNCYVNNFGPENVNNEDIAIAKEKIPNNVDLLVGGFPCQDYSVAATKAKGIEGKKGVLWWEISWILKHKKPKMVLLENVDRLLKSPSAKRGRDFAIMLFNLNKLGYDVEWQVINAADYGMPQRRKRVFIFAKLRECFETAVMFDDEQTLEEINESSVFSTVFPVVEKSSTKVKQMEFSSQFDDELDITENYNGGKFLTKGFLINGDLLEYEIEVDPNFNPERLCLRDILQNPDEIEEKFYLNQEQLKKWKN